MSWNEPGGGKDKNPWGSGNKQDGPPDLDELIKKMQDKFNNFMGGKGKKGNGSIGGGSGGGSVSVPGKFGFGLLIAIAFAVWIITGIYIIDPAERGVVLRFGEYSETTGPGPHWHIPYPIEDVEKVNVDALRTASHRSQMLTKDENLLQAELSVQYQVKSAEDYLFKVRDPDYTLKEATESALREVVGAKTLDDIISLGGGRDLLVNDTEKSVQAILDKYQTGLIVTKVNLESTQPPQEVQSAFEDAIKAREDKDRYKKQAEAYERDIIPKAEGDAQSLVQEAEGYKREVIERSRGETSRFLQTLKEYTKAPEITRVRMYIETMEAVLSNSSKVMIKVDNGGSIMYLPLDRLMKGDGSKTLDKNTLRELSNNTSRLRSNLNSRTISRPLDVRGRGGR
ncbi:MAG: FtsH protease activity modulator HflK [Gammaproteobacteria bacterium]|nr:FtsH protease activity modulator HflK [Gammaproteobacteria bacterium]